MDREEVFTPAQIKDAIDREETILTAWNLFLQIKVMIEWNWNPKTIQDLFYNDGRMSKVPTHYKPIGKIINYFGDAKAIGVELTYKLCKGDRIGYFLKNEFFEENIYLYNQMEKMLQKLIPGKQQVLKRNIQMI